jgi:hypothetical protein
MRAMQTDFDVQGSRAKLVGRSVDAQTLECPALGRVIFGHFQFSDYSELLPSPNFLERASAVRKPKPPRSAPPMC